MAFFSSLSVFWICLCSCLIFSSIFGNKSRLKSRTSVRARLGTYFWYCIRYNFSAYFPEMLEKTFHLLKLFVSLQSSLSSGEMGTSSVCGNWWKALCMCPSLGSSGNWDRYKGLYGISLLRRGFLWHKNEGQWESIKDRWRVNTRVITE